jgi:putative oxidoreductase
LKIVVLIVRLLLGLVFFVFGLNAFLQFINGPMPGGLAGQYFQALFQSHYALAVGAVQAVGGVLLLINRYVPLALTILGPVIVNILLYHLLLNHEGIGGGLIVAVFWFVLFFHYRQYFSGIFTANVGGEDPSTALSADLPVPSSEAFRNVGTWLPRIRGFRLKL